MAPIKDIITISSRAVVCVDTELKGEVTIGSGTVVHPKATIFAASGPIVIGSNCIIEEKAVIVNRRKEVMRIGDLNLFAVGSRTEAPSIGTLNTFGVRSSTASTVRITNSCTVGAGCALVSTLSADELLSDPTPLEFQDPTPRDEVIEPYTVLYLEGDGDERVTKRRTWNGDGEEAERELRLKSAHYLCEMLPKVTRLRT